MTELHSVGFSVNNRLGDLFTVRLVATIVLEFDVEVKTAFTGVYFVALSIGAIKVSTDVIVLATDVLLPSIGVFFSHSLAEILLVIVKLFDLNDAFKD